MDDGFLRDDARKDISALLRLDQVAAGFKTRILEPSFGTRLQEVVAGRELNPRPLGYEDYN